MKITHCYIKNRQTLFIRIAHKKEKVLYRLFELDNKYWNAGAKTVRSSHPMAGQLLATIKNATENIENIIKTNRYTTCSQIKEHLNNHGYKIKAVDTDSTIGFIDLHIIGKKNQTTKNYRSLAKWISKFDAQIKLHEWSKIKMHEFQTFIDSQPTINSHNTKVRYLTDLRAVLNYATYLEILPISENPFSTGFKIESFKPKDVKLELEEIKKLYALSAQHEGARWFMLMYFLDGARPNEALKLKWSDINNGVIRYEQSKTGKKMQVTITPKIQQCLQYFINDGIYVVAGMNRSTAIDEHTKASNVLKKMNLKLKEACKLAGISVITSHVARHTFAYLAQDAGYSILELQQALNHSKPEITAGYVGRLKGDKMDSKRNNLHKLF